MRHMREGRQVKHPLRGASRRPQHRDAQRQQIGAPAQGPGQPWNQRMKGQQPGARQQPRGKLSRQSGRDTADQDPWLRSCRRILGGKRRHRTDRQPQSYGRQHTRAPAGQHQDPGGEPLPPGHRCGQDGGRQPAPLLAHDRPGQGHGAGGGQNPAVADDHGQVALNTQLVAEESLHGRVVRNHLLKGVLNSGGEDSVGQTEDQTSHRPPAPQRGTGAQGKP